MKVTVVGAGNVGATCAQVIAEKEICNSVVLLDIKQGMAEGKALDMLQMAPLALYDTRTLGVTNDYAATADSEIVVITSGFPRSPGMSREDLVATNAQIVKTVTENIVKYSPNAILVVVSNPLDAMAYCALKASKFPPERVMGMAGLLDTARYRAFLASELDCSPKDIQAIILGGHGDDMVPLKDYTTVSGVPVSQLIRGSKLEEIIKRTRVGGGELVSLMGKSAWYAPGYAAARMVEAMIRNQKRYYPVSAFLQGEYGLDDMYFGVPVKLGKKGIEGILEINLKDAEKNMVAKSAESVRASIKMMKDNIKFD
ncbi:MAG TPA: malate dehydrogenase [Bacteroidales bacterium]|nr:malate dehydrogenase [Bacteroidales bacterium]